MFLLNQKTQAISRVAPGQSLVCFLYGLALATCGCSSSNELGREALAGSVTLDNAPLAVGSIEFSPQDGASVGSGATIIEGKYSIEEKRGLPPGKYLVRIYAAEDDDSPMTPEEAAMPELKRPGRDLIPPEYNTKSSTVVEITDDGPNEFDFRVNSKT